MKKPGLVFILFGFLSLTWTKTPVLISKDDLWSNDFVMALLENGRMIPSVSFENTYWGLKLDDMMAWIHVERLSNNGISIKEYAFNLTKSMDIIAGQNK